MQSKRKRGLFFIAFVCGHKDTTIFVITKIVIYLYRKYLDYYCVRAQKNDEQTHEYTGKNKNQGHCQDG